MRPKLTTDLPKRLRTARAYRGLTQGELAARTHQSPSAISHFEVGTRRPSCDNLRRLADGLDVTADYLLGRIDTFTATVRPDQAYQALRAEDRKVADDLIALLAQRAKKLTHTPTP